MKKPTSNICFTALFAIENTYFTNSTVANDNTFDCCYYHIRLSRKYSSNMIWFIFYKRKSNKRYKKKEEKKKGKKEQNTNYLKDTTVLCVPFSKSMCACLPKPAFFTEIRN